MTESQQIALDVVEKLDPSSTTVMKLLHDIYKLNMATINFWLNTCVFPRETMQFCKRLTANAFDLAENINGVIGFSGTKDKRLLLPVQVRQAVPQSECIKATDGKMAELVLQNDSVFQIPAGRLFEETVKLALSQNLDALIDVGAAMAGLSNEEVALLIIEIAKRRKVQHWKGAVYHDENMNSWATMSWDRRRWLLGCSPIRECDAFIYFDEAHCRGADMHMKENACALLTVGPDMCKDKLIHAAGRLRKLDRGQSLRFAVPPELVNKIARSNGSTIPIQNLLNWVLENTVQSIASGMVEWALQGVQFCATRHANARITDEIFGLKELYGGSKKAQSVSMIASRAAGAHRERMREMRVVMGDDEGKILAKIERHLKVYGSDFEVIRLVENEECEREVEHEREIEAEAEKEILRQEPLEHKLWEYGEVLQCKCVADIPITAGVRSFTDVIGTMISEKIVHAVKWDMCNFFVTENFRRTVDSSEHTACASGVELGDYLRPVDGILFFRCTRQMVLLSEYESNGVLHAMWSRGEYATAISYVNFQRL